MTLLSILSRKRASFSLLFFLFLVSCNQNPVSKPAFQYAGATMGTTFSVKITQLPETVQQEQLPAHIDQILIQVNARMSTYQQNSELSILNRNPSTDWISCSEDLLQVLNEAQRISQLSDGGFDVTVGPLVNLWGFGSQMKTNQPPDTNKIESHLQRIGYKKLTIRQSPPAIKKQHADINIDLSALAKGFGVDQLADYLESLGIHDYMVEIGGELRVKGKNAQGQFWRIAVEKPDPTQRTVQNILSLNNIAIATSGDYRNFFEADGQLFSHTLDPRTGQPVTHNLASVTVLSEQAMTADAIATAMMVLGNNAGYKLAQAQQWAVLFITREEGHFTTLETSPFTALIHR